MHTCAYVLKTVWIIENYASSRSPRRNLIKDRPRNGFERGTARIALSLAFTFASLLGTPKCLPASLICTRLLPIKLSYRKGKPTFTRLNDRAFYPSFESRTEQEYLENSRLSSRRFLIIISLCFIARSFQDIFIVRRIKSRISKVHNQQFLY